MNGPRSEHDRPARADKEIQPDRPSGFDIVLEAVYQMPAIRAERVAILKQRIATGTYHVPDHLLAQKLLAFPG